MLALFRPRCLLHSPRLLQVRTLRVLPRKIPKHMSRWDPTLHRAFRAREESTESLHEPPATDVEPQPMEQVSHDDMSHEWYGVRKEDRKTPHKIKKFQYLMRKALANPTELESLRAPLWESYVLAKRADPNLPSEMSKGDWDTLQAAQSIGSPSNRKRDEHLEELASDMRAAGWLHPVETRAQYIMNMFLRGQKSKALKLWGKDQIRYHKGEEVGSKAEHLEVGARLHSLGKNLNVAQKHMDELFSLYPDWDPSVMMVVFRAHTSSNNAKHHVIAREIYCQMKERKASSCTLEDYDSWLVGFLEARNVEYAKQVFQDMIQHGSLATGGSPENITEVLRRLNMLYRLGTDIQSMTGISLDALAILPRSYHGHLYGDWMKTAVVQRAPEATAQILDMMIERGCTPETFHLNMLLKALIRSKEEPNLLKAENIGWRMINKAGRTADQKKVPRYVHQEIYEREMQPSSLDAMTANNNTLPVADSTTFGLLMQYHSKKAQWEHVDYLFRQLEASAVKANTMILNVLIDNNCRKGNYVEAWSTYCRLTSSSSSSSSDTEGVFPDGATFRHLWKNLRLALGDHTTRNDPGLPLPRHLLKETNSWWMKCRSRYDAARFRMGFAARDGGAVTALILHCFSYNQDLPGSLVAMQFLRHKFDIFPTDRVVKILHRQMAWVDLTYESESTRAQFHFGRSNARNMDRIKWIYMTLLQKRLKQINREGIKEEDLTKEQIGDLGLNLLSEFIRTILLDKYGAPLVEIAIQSAKNASGMPHLPTGDKSIADIIPLDTNESELSFVDID